MLKVEHIGIAVKSIAAAVPVYEKLFNTDCYKTETIVAQRVNTAFLRLGESKIELLEGLNAESVIGRFIEKRGEGLHHIAFEVADIEEEMQRLQGEGFTLLNNVPARGADNKLVCFIQPKETNGVLIELCQEIKPVNNF